MSRYQRNNCDTLIIIHRQKIHVMAPPFNYRQDEYVKPLLVHFPRVLLEVLGRVKKYSIYTVMLPCYGGEIRGGH